MITKIFLCLRPTSGSRAAGKTQRTTPWPKASAARLGTTASVSTSAQIRPADTLSDLRTGQDTTGCADALRERRCLHVAIIVAMFLLVAVLMGLPYRTNALCGRYFYQAIRCYYWAAVASLFIFAAAGACLACLCLNDRVRQNTPEALSAAVARYRAQVAIRARLRAALLKGEEAAAPIVEELIENLDVRPAEP